MKRTTLVAVTAGGLAALALAGCTGHGKYTSEHANLAQTRLDLLKGKTEFDMAMQAFLAGDLRKADRKAEIALALHPDFARALTLRGRVAIEEGDMGRAVATLTRATEADADFVEAWYYLGVACERLRRREEAVAAYRRAAELEPFEAAHVVALGETLIDMGRYGEAMGTLEASPAATDSAAIRHLMGHVAMIEGDAARAVTLLEDARLLAPDDAIIAEDLVDAQAAAGRYADAEFGLTRLLASVADGERRDLRMLRVRCLRELDRLEEAYAALIELTSAPEGREDTAAWIAFGEVAYLLGEDSATRRAASKLIAAAPQRHEGYALFALQRLATDDAVRALKAIDDGLRRSGDHADLLGLRAVALASLGRDEEARAAFAALEASGDTGVSRVVERVRATIESLPYAVAPTD